MSLWAEIRLNVKEGTILSLIYLMLNDERLMNSEIVTVPMGSLTRVDTTAVMVVKRDGQLII